MVPFLGDLGADDCFCRGKACRIGGPSFLTETEAGNKNRRGMEAKTATPCKSRRCGWSID